MSGAARHEGASRNGRRNFLHRILAGPGHHSPSGNSTRLHAETNAEEIRKNSIKMSMKRITVLLAEDHTIVREGFRKMLEFENDMEVVGEAQDGRQAVALTQKLRPNVVLMDIAMPLL